MQVYMRGIKMQHTPCSLVYHGALHCEGEHVCYGAYVKTGSSKESQQRFLPVQFIDV